MGPYFVIAAVRFEPGWGYLRKPSFATEIERERERGIERERESEREREREREGEKQGEREAGPMLGRRVRVGPRARAPGAGPAPPA